MTVIVYRDGVLAADTGYFRANLQLGSFSKIEPVPGGWAATCGRDTDGEAFVRWLSAGGDPERRPELLDRATFHALTLRAAQDIEEWDEGLVPMPARMSARGPWHTIGSGSAVASGALAMGATAVEAVFVACDLHAHCSAPVDFVTLDRAGVRRVNSPAG